MRSWLVCQQICVPEDAAVTLTLQVGAPTPDPAVAKDFAAARALLPVASPWKLTYALGNTLDIYVAAPALAAAHPKTADFFPATAASSRTPRRSWWALPRTGWCCG